MREDQHEALRIARELVGGRRQRGVDRPLDAIPVLVEPVGRPLETLRDDAHRLASRGVDPRQVFGVMADDEPAQLAGDRVVLEHRPGIAALARHDQ